MKQTPWQPKTTTAPNDRAWWGTRKVSCGACGYDARHYGAEYVILSDGCPLFCVPYSGLNGGTGHELDAEYWDLGPAEMTVYLSECCDAPRMIRRKVSA